MSQSSREEFLAYQAEQQNKSMRKANSNKSYVNYFNLKDDGDEAIVRFAYSDPSELEIFTTHGINVDGKFKRVNCLRSFKDPFDMCPLCAAGQNNQQRTYIKLIEYSRDERGSIVATPKIWERPVVYVQILTNLFTEYGNLSDCVFKVKRSGEKGSRQTNYSIMYCSPTVYNQELYPKDFSAFDDYKVLGGPLADLDYAGLQKLVPHVATSNTPRYKSAPYGSTLAQNRDAAEPVEETEPKVASIPATQRAYSYAEAPAGTNPRRVVY